MIGTLFDMMTMPKTLISMVLENHEMHRVFGLHSNKLQVIRLERALYLNEKWKKEHLFIGD